MSTAVGAGARLSFGDRAGLLARRLAAYALDCVLLLVAAAAAQAALVAGGLHPFVRDGRLVGDPTPAALHAWVFLCTTLPFLIYFTACFTRGGTLGQRALGVGVRGGDGARLRFWPSLLRGAVLLAPFEINHATMFHTSDWTAPATPPLTLLGIALTWGLCALYVLLPLLRADGRSVPDLFANAMVRRS